MRARILLALVIAVAVAGFPVARAAEETSCTKCHGDAELFEGEDLAIVGAWHESVHATVGISCHDCHGGNPDPALGEDDAGAMDAHYTANPFRGVPARKDIPRFCGSCHSDPEYMKRFRPDARIDQEEEYWTSYHGKALARGDERVATCVDCHGVHDILHAGDPSSSVYPPRVADTCGHCHSDPKRMAGTVVAGHPIPVDQVARWRDSVHGIALTKKGDLSAPTCNDCHGNHGATPPGVASVTFVCGQCHGREAELLRGSPKYAGLEEHQELLADAGPEGCRSCHETPDPAATLPAGTKLGQCTACHGNHSIGRPTSALFANLPDTPCALCHGDGGAVAEASPEPEQTLENFQRTRDALLEEAARQGLDGEARYDWLVDRALELPPHTRPVEEEGVARAVARPEFTRLFGKFRVGKIHYSFVDPATGETRQERVRRCSDCHAQDPSLAEESRGLQVASTMVGRMQELETSIARAERMLLTAKRGGVEVGEAEIALDEAVDSQIELQVLVHSFSVAEGGPFLKTHGEAMGHAEGALEASVAALHELGVRRRGLIVSLVAIVLVLAGLGWSIREDTRKSRETSAGAG